MRTRASQLPTVGVIKSTLPVSNFRARPQPTPPTLRGREVGPTSIPTLREGRILYPIRGTTPARTQHRSRYLDRLFGDKPEVEAKAKRPATLPPCPTVCAHTPPSISVRVNGDKTWRCARTLRPVLPPIRQDGAEL